MKRRFLCVLAAVLMVMTLLPVGVKAENAENLDVMVGEAEEAQAASFVAVETESAPVSDGEMDRPGLWLTLFAVAGLVMIGVAALDDSRKRYE